MKHSILAVIVLLSTNAMAQVEELSNSEMTEAFIKDGNIVVKQKAVTPQPKAEQAINIKVGPGEPVVSETDKERLRQRQQYQQQVLIEQELPNKASDQLTNYQIRNNSMLTLPALQSETAKQQREYAQELVRDGLNLPDGTAITNQHMAQYLNTFQGQSTGQLMGPQQTFTADGFEFVIPNPGNYPTGVHTSGDGTIQLETSNQQLIFKLLYPNTVE